MLRGMTWQVIVLIGAVGIIMLIGSALLNRRAQRLAEGRPVDWEALRTDVAAALDRDDLAGAVKIYRQRTNAGLLAAADAVQQIDGDRR
ncbi:hypothetical protein GCM10027605_55970 [Micromonospora zhanjiangensis]